MPDAAELTRRLALLLIVLLGGIVLGLALVAVAR